MQFSKTQLRWSYIFCVIVFTGVGVFGIYRYYWKERIIQNTPLIKGAVVSIDCSRANPADKVEVTTGTEEYSINVENYDCNTINLGDTISFHKSSLPHDGILHNENVNRDLYGSFAFLAFAAYALYYLIRSYRDPNFAASANAPLVRKHKRKQRR